MSWKQWAVGLLCATVLLGAAQAGAPSQANAGPPSSHPKSLAICSYIQQAFALGDPIWVDLEPARGRKYRGGESILVYYESIAADTGADGCHFIIRSGKVLHGPHVKFNVPYPTIRG